MDIKRMTSGKPFWLAALCAVLSVLSSVAWPKSGSVLEPGVTCQLFSDTLNSEVVVFLLPLVSVLPYGEGFLREYQTGAIRLILSRSSRKEYGKEKVTVLAVSGGMVWMLACLSAFFFLFLLLYPLEMRGKWDMIQMQNILEAILRLGIVANICSVLSGVFGTLFLSAYMAYGMPFVIFYLLVILNKRYAAQIYCINPEEWLNPVHDWGQNNGGIWIFLFLLWLLLNLFHALLLKRRLREI